MGGRSDCLIFYGLSLISLWLGSGGGGGMGLSASCLPLSFSELHLFTLVTFPSPLPPTSFLLHTHSSTHPALLLSATIRNTRRAPLSNPATTTTTLLL